MHHKLLVPGLLGLCAGLFSPRTEAPMLPDLGPPPAPAHQAQACVVCHPGARKALAQGPHFALARQAQGCITCHGPATAHVRSAKDPATPTLPAGPVQAKACASCHEAPLPAVARAAHPLAPKAQRRNPPPHSRGPIGPEPDGPVQAEPSIRWQAEFVTGFRSVDHRGNRDRYDTDYNLQRGFRLAEGRLRADFSRSSLLDGFELRAEGLGDPHERVRGSIHKTDRYELDASWHNSKMKYRASGDYGRLDRRDRGWGFDLEVPLGEAVELFGNLSRSSLEGQWLTRRIGDRNLVPLTSIAGVRSPQRTDELLGELGLLLKGGQTSLRLSLDYLDQNEDQQWAYSRPAQANAAFTESEDSRSDGSLEGPGARLHLDRHTEQYQLGLSARMLDRRRRLIDRSTGTGYDVAAFQSNGFGLAEGAARSYQWELDGSLFLTDALSLDLGARYLDHREHLFVDRTDIAFYPSLSSTVTARSQRDQRSSSRQREADLQLDYALSPALRIHGGWGWSQEKLAVPDLELVDSDFRRGTIKEHGWLGGLLWKPDAHWRVSGRYRGFGQGGMRLHEVMAQRSRLLAGRLGWHSEAFWWELGAENRNNRSIATNYRNDSTTYTASLGLGLGEDFQLQGGMSHNQLDSRSLTNFYFNPAFTAVPTVVGFTGDTLTSHLALDWQANRRLRLGLQGSYTRVQGDYAFDLYQWSLDTRLRLNRRGSVGVRLQQLDYEEAAGVDDHGAWLTMFYCEVGLGGS